MTTPNDETPDFKEDWQWQLTSSEKEEERRAAQRRQERKRRLAQITEEPTTTLIDNGVESDKIRHFVVENAALQQQDTKKSTENTNTAESLVKETSPSDESDEDSFDMFSSSASPTDNNPKIRVSVSKPGKEISGGDYEEDAHDTEGYYRAVMGEQIHLKLPEPQSQPHPYEQQQSTIPSSSLTPLTNDYGSSTLTLRVQGVVGKGVFSTVLKCSHLDQSQSTHDRNSHHLNDDDIPRQDLPSERTTTVAVKFIRHNDAMRKAAITEIETLQKLNGSPGIIPLLFPQTSKSPIEYRGHIVIGFPYMDFNLRQVLHKFGARGVGLSLTGVRSYFAQLLQALTHLQQHRIIHADLKPDNILVSEDFSTVKIADFGSCIICDAPEASLPATPYLVSRFYRAPEIILGLSPKYASDLWSLSVTVVELFLGRVLFNGSNNNDMLRCFLEILGPCPNRIIRQHLVQCERLPMLERHFEPVPSAFHFRQQSHDKATGNPVVIMRSLTDVRDKDASLHLLLLKARSKSDPRHLVSLFSELLQSCFAWDPTRRVSCPDALKHDFFTKVH